MITFAAVVEEAAEHPVQPIGMILLHGLDARPRRPIMAPWTP
jgi:hypothetical protein